MKFQLEKSQRIFRVLKFPRSLKIKLLLAADKRYHTLHRCVMMPCDKKVAKRQLYRSNILNCILIIPDTNRRATRKLNIASLTAAVW